MAGIEEMEPQELERNECCFEWDETTQLYFHASSGFYHDPGAGWYYSSRDGLYYKFENGSYTLLESNKVDESEAYQGIGTGPDEPTPVNSTGNAEFTSDKVPEIPPPPSQWLEDTLIDLYLSGYPDPAANDVPGDETMPLVTHEKGNFKPSADGDTLMGELEEGEWVSEEFSGLADSSESVLDEDALRDEENWRAQYGQVVQSEEQPEIPVVDLWDWRMVRESRSDKKRQATRLIGRLVRRSAKVHPSMPSGGAFLKTAPICEAHLDLVRVTTGQVYKLRSPSARYLASLSTYDSSNPTIDWGFPELSSAAISKSHGKSELKTGSGMPVNNEVLMLADPLSTSKKHGSGAYRDRAAERRTLHGGFGVGPGQKNSAIDNDGSPSSPVSSTTEEAAAEALNMSFGAGSYARKILESMGWKEGEALGNTMKGIVEPIQAVGNIGSAGLGWPQGRAKHG